MENRIKCELCGLDCSMQISASHLRVKHNMTTKEYRALGYKTLSPARLHQLHQNPVGSGNQEGIRRLYGKDHPNWKGGHINGAGYRIVYHNGKRMVEHRVVAEQMIGRPLEANEIVHHIDGNRSNNSQENLVVMLSAEHDKIKIKTKQYFHTNEHCEQAVRELKKLGWSISKISHALRVERRTVIRWLNLD